MGTRILQRKIRVLNGAWAILEIIQNQPFRCVFVGEMPLHLNGGRVPLGLDLILIPQPGYQNPPDITNLLCQYQSTKFKFRLDRNQLKYVDLAGGIPAGKQNWCEVKIMYFRGSPPCQFDLDNVVEIYGIPTIRIFDLFIDTLRDVLDRYNTLRGVSWLTTKNQIKAFRTVVDALLKKAIVPRNLDQACTALSISKQLLAILAGRSPTSTRIQQLINCLRKVTDQIESWVKTHHASVNDARRPLPVTQDVDKGPEPLTSNAVGEDPEESEDWVEVTISAGVIETHGINSYHCGEQVDEVFDFEFLNMD